VFSFARNGRATQDRLKAKSARERDAPPDVGLPSLGANRFCFEHL
jgi:hypothetical protein